MVVILSFLPPLPSAPAAKDAAGAEKCTVIKNKTVCSFWAAANIVKD
jgi:hypothetical protein